MRDDDHVPLSIEHLVPQYQPIVDLASHAVIGAELFVRQRHRHGGLTPVMAWLPDAVSSGAMTLAMTEWLPTWAAGPPVGDDMTISINAFGRDIADDDYCRAVAAAGEAAACRLALEISHLEFDLDIARRVAPAWGWIDVPDLTDRLGDLRASGVEVWLDDLGEGHHDRSMLDAVEFDVVKLDRSLLTDSVNELRSVVSAVHEFDCEALIEGIESSEQAETALDVGADLGQGYAFGAPTVLDDFAGLVVDRRVRRRDRR